MSDDLLDIEINGKALKAQKGAMIIEVADEAGLIIPRFCYHKKLSVAANCRMCLVEVEKAPKPLPACATPVMNGMVVRTKSSLALQAQKSVMEFLLINHPLDCPICDQGGECELQDVAMGFGRGLSRFNERKRVVEDKNLGPLISTDMTRCIHCTRCVRFGEEIGGFPELGMTGRGENVEIGTFIERNIDSELSGNVIDVCPVGALTSKPFRYRARSWEMQQRDAVAPHDAVGSNLHVHIMNGRVMRVVPRENESINEVWLSDRDRFSYEGLYSEDRLQRPLVKQAGDWAEVDWTTAIEAAANGLKQVVQSGGAPQVGALVSPSVTTEEAYLVQKLIRGLGSNNIDCRLRQNDFRDQDNDGSTPSLGTSFEQLEGNDATLLVGSDCRREQPIANHRLRKSVRNGGRVCVVNSIDYDFNYDLDTAVITGPSGMVHAMAEIAQACGVSIDGGPVQVSADAKAIAQTLKDAGQCSVVLGNSALSSPYAADLKAFGSAIAAHVNASFGMLADGCNAAGTALGGALPHRGPGGKNVATPGLTVKEMLDQKLKAWVLCGVEPTLDLQDGQAATEALANADFVLSLSSHATADLKAHADVILPIAPFAENSGTVINAQGDRQSFVAAVPALGDSRPGWKVLRVLGNALEIAGFDYVTVDEVLAALSDVSSANGEYELPGELPKLDEDVLWRLGDVPIYATDMLVRRAYALQATNLAATNGAYLSSSTRRRFGLDDMDTVLAKQNGSSVSMPLVVDDRVADNCVRIVSGVDHSAELGANYGPLELAKS